MHRVRPFILGLLLNCALPVLGAVEPIPESEQSPLALYAGGDLSIAGGKASAHLARAYVLPLALSVLRSGSNLTLSWSSVDTAGFALQQADALVPSATWVSNTAPVTDDGTNKPVTVPATNNLQFFRLRRL